ncbi:MAG: type VII toxin-antitoxin system MntA family adenylyltransferase antitoxin [Pseudomonadales bacterium]
MSLSRLEIVNRITKSFPGVELIYLFGSRAKREASENSDWDLAILSRVPIDNFARWECAQALAVELAQDVDLVDLSNASTVLQQQVVDSGELLYGEREREEYFAVTVMSMYQHLQEQRATLVEAFVEEVRRDGE